MDAASLVLPRRIATLELSVELTIETVEHSSMMLSSANCCKPVS